MAEINKKHWELGRLQYLDKLEHGDPAVAQAIQAYADSINVNRQSNMWQRVSTWVENILFGLGHHYHRDIITNRIVRDSDGNSFEGAQNTLRKIPQPTNDFLGRFVETNIALLTENRPEPRITPKSDDRADKQAAEIGQLTVQYHWEQLNIPEKLREIARLCLYTGTSWLEVGYDPTQQRHMTIPQVTTESATIPGANGIITLPVDREVPVIDERGRPRTGTQLEYGDITATVVSGFEMHFPSSTQGWDSEQMSWVMREYSAPMDVIIDKYTDNRISGLMTKKNGWFIENLKALKGANIYNLPIWWWDRLSDAVEGPGPTIHVGNKDNWDDHAIVRIFDRKPNGTWPLGRTIITVNDKLLYDSPKKTGARAFNPRWPKRWHPYIRFRWEGSPGSTYGRSLVSKLLPKLKRVNAIDTTLIMWRRTVPIATWIYPKGTVPNEGQINGRPGGHIVYDPRQTNGMEPKPVYPPEYPRSAIEERSTQISEMEAIAGTEEVLRGQRPTGVNSASMLSVLRKQALASRSAIIQTWDESLQLLGSSLLQETVAHIKDDPRYAQRIQILARESASQFSIDRFSGTDIGDNVVVRVDTASQAMVSREARQQRALELLQYAPGLATLPPTLQAKLIDDLGWPDGMAPKGADISRAQILIGFIKSNKFDFAVPMREDDCYVLHELLVEQAKKEAIFDWSTDQVKKLFELIDYYKADIQRIEMSRLRMTNQVAAEQAMAAAAPEMALKGQ